MQKMQKMRKLSSLVTSLCEVEQLGHWSVLLQHGQPLASILASFLRAVSLKIDWNSRTMVLRVRVRVRVRARVRDRLEQQDYGPDI